MARHFGLEADYQTLQKKNADGYELFLTDLLLGHFGKDVSPLSALPSTRSKASKSAA